MSLQSLDQKTSAISERMETAIDNLASQMDSLLDISKLDAGLVEIDNRPIDLVALLSRLKTEYIPITDRKGLELNFVCEFSEAKIESDTDSLERVFRNLISNAIKCTHTGSLTLSIKEAGSDWIISIIDTGIGIAPEEQSRIFEEFYQIDNKNRDRKKGLGLGLAIVKRLVDLLHIKIQFTSMAGTGTQFDLHVKKSKHDLELFDSNRTPQSIEGIRILCIDDEVEIRDALEQTLRSVGCTVFTAAGYTQAVSIVNQETIDIVLADFRLDEEQNGLDVIEELKHLNSDLAAILITGDTAPERLTQARNAGVKTLYKPVKASVLFEEIFNSVELTKAKTNNYD